MSAKGEEEQFAKIAEALGVVRCCGTALGAMAQYSDNTRDELDEMLDIFDDLPSMYHRLAPDYMARLEKCQDLVKENGKIINDAIEFYKRALRTRPKEVQQRKCNCGCFEDDSEFDEDAAAAAAATSTAMGDDDDMEEKNKSKKQGRVSESDHDHDHQHDPEPRCHDDDQSAKKSSSTAKKQKKVAWEHQQMAQNIVQQFYREWSVEGVIERDECFKPIVDRCRKFIDTLCSGDEAPRTSNLKCLVPGAGMCRLAYEIAAALPQVDVVACEVSHAMLLPAQYLLGGNIAPNTYTMYPFAHITGNVMHAESMQHAAAHVPDVRVDPQMLISKHLTVTTEDFIAFCESQPRHGGFEMLATCFFIDTSFNILDYIRASTLLLKKGGIWINSGPLHWVHSQWDSIRLSMDEIVHAMEIVGYEFIEAPTVMPYRHYCSPPGSLMPMVFDCCIWVAKLTQ